MNNLFQALSQGRRAKEQMHVTFNSFSLTERMELARLLNNREVSTV